MNETHYLLLTYIATWDFSATLWCKRELLKTSMLNIFIFFFKSPWHLDLQGIFIYGTIPWDQKLSKAPPMKMYYLSQLFPEDNMMLQRYSIWRHMEFLQVHRQFRPIGTLIMTRINAHIVVCLTPTTVYTQNKLPTSIPIIANQFGSTLQNSCIGPRSHWCSQCQWLFHTIWS